MKMELFGKEIGSQLILCQKHEILNIEKVTPKNEIIVNCALHTLQTLSNDSDVCKDYEMGEAIQKQYWNVRNSLEKIGIQVKYNAFKFLVIQKAWNKKCFTFYCFTKKCKRMMDNGIHKKKL